MSNELFPRTEVGGISLPRLICGTNWVAGWSHRSPAADAKIKEHHADTSEICKMLEVYLKNGIDAVMCPFDMAPVVKRAVDETEQKTGQHIIRIDTPIFNPENTPEARREAEATIRHSREMGADFCLLHHASAERLLNRLSHKIECLDDYTKMIRDAGMIPGLSAHMPEMVVYSDENENDIETYIQIYNAAGFLMQVEIETVNRIIWNAKKPVMTIKSMAAGRLTPFVGLNFSWATIRDCDMVTVGCFSAREAEEDIEISRAALEHRLPNIGKRSSPNQNQAAFGK